MSDKYDVERMLNRLVDDDKPKDQFEELYSWQSNQYREKNTKDMSVDDLVNKIDPKTIRKVKKSNKRRTLQAQNAEENHTETDDSDIKYRSTQEVQEHIDEQNDVDSKEYLNDMLDRMEKELNRYENPLKPKVVAKKTSSSEEDTAKLENIDNVKEKKVVKLKTRKKSDDPDSESENELELDENKDNISDTHKFSSLDNSTTTPSNENSDSDVKIYGEDEDSGVYDDSIEEISDVNKEKEKKKKGLGFFKKHKKNNADDDNKKSDENASEKIKEEKDLDDKMEDVDIQIENLSNSSEEEKKQFAEDIFSPEEKSAPKHEKESDDQKKSESDLPDDYSEIFPENAQKKSQNKEDEKEKGYYYFGIIVSILAICGIIFLILFMVRRFIGTSSEDSLKEDIKTAVYPAVVVDIDAFDNPENISDTQKIGSGIINIIMNSDTSEYKITAGRMNIPSEDVEKSVQQLYGSSAKIDKHQNFSINNIVFSYNSDSKSYSVPTKPLIYTANPIVNKVKTEGEIYDAEILYTVDYPDFIENRKKNKSKITFYKSCIYDLKKDQSGNYYISSMRVEKEAK